MSKDLRTQLAERCIYFTGLMNKTCKAGVEYKDVRVKPSDGGLYQLPCIQTGGNCDKCKFLSDEEVEKELKDIEELSEKTFIIYALIKENFNTEGFVDCTCGGKVKFVKASSNGHIWCKCNKCDLGFNE